MRTSTQISEGVYEVAANVDDTINIPYIVAETDTGLFVHALVTSVPAGKYLLAYREMICLRDVLRIWSRVNGVKASFGRTTFEEDAALDMERAETFAFANEHGYDGGDPEIVHAKDVRGIPPSSIFPLPLVLRIPNYRGFSSFCLERNF